MTDVIRPLNITDVSGIESLVNSRDVFLESLPIDHAAVIANINHQISIGAPQSVALFRDGILDCFYLWRYVNDSPRADDLTLTDPIASFSYSLWSLARPDREKTITGHDVNYSLLVKEQLRLLEENNVYTTWSVYPDGWRVTTDSPLLETEMQRWVRRDMGYADPEQPWSGDAETFLRRIINSQPNSYQTKLIARAITIPTHLR